MKSVFKLILVLFFFNSSLFSQAQKKVYICDGDYGEKIHCTTNCRGLNNCLGKIYYYDNILDGIKSGYEFCLICWEEIYSLINYRDLDYTYNDYLNYCKEKVYLQEGKYNGYPVFDFISTTTRGAIQFFDSKSSYIPRTYTFEHIDDRNFKRLIKEINYHYKYIGKKGGISSFQSRQNRINIINNQNTIVVIEN